MRKNRSSFTTYIFSGTATPTITSITTSLPRESLNNKPCILVKHAIQAFFQNTGLIFTQICLFSLISCFLFWYRQVLCANSFTILAELSLHRAGKPALNYLVAEHRERVKATTRRKPFAIR